MKNRSCSTGLSLVNENVIPYCYVKMSPLEHEGFCGGREAGWTGSTDDRRRAGAHVPRPLFGGTSTWGPEAIVDPEPIVQAPFAGARPRGADRRAQPGEVRG